MDELFEALTLIQTRKIKNFPVILYGSEFWAGMLDWLENVILQNKYISAEDRGLLHLTDSPAEVVGIIHRSMDALSKMEAESSDL